MPGVTVGVYTGQEDAGTQVSSTYEGRHLTVREDELIHPCHSDGFVDKGDPVCVCDAGVPTTYGNLVGVAFRSGSAAADWIGLDTEGIWNLTVYAENDAGNVAIEIGDPLYMRVGSLPAAADADGTGDGELSKITDNATQVFFGYALGSMVAGGSGRIAVKVHAAPWPEQEERRYQTVATGAYSYGFHETAILAAGQSTGLHYKDCQVGGQQAGGIYGFGAWMELQSDFLHLDNAILVALEGGFYETAADIGDSWLIGLQLQYIIHENPNIINHFRVNIAAAGGTMSAVFAAANVNSIGYAADATTDSSKCGDIPFVTVGGNTYYIRLYDAAS